MNILSVVMAFNISFSNCKCVLSYQIYLFKDPTYKNKEFYEIELKIFTTKIFKNFFWEKYPYLVTKDVNLQNM